MGKKNSLAEWVDITFTKNGYAPAPFENLAKEYIPVAEKIHREFEKHKIYSSVCLDTLNSTELFYEKSLKILSALIKIGKLNNEILTVEVFCRKVTEILAEELDFDNCSIMLRDNDEECLYVVAGCGRENNIAGGHIQRKDRRLKFGEGIAGRVAETGEYILIPDTENDPRFVPVDTDIKVGSLLSAPLLNEGKITGVINFSHTHVETFDTGTIRLLMLLCNYISQTITMNSLHNKMNEWQDMLRTQKLESLGILAGGIAHDFNNILTAILGNVSLVKIGLDPSERIFTRLDAVEKASIRAIDLTQQLLTFSKGGAPVKKTTSITELIRESAQFALRGSNVRSEFMLQDDLLSVEADKGQLSQVIHNLVINADQAMPEGGTLTISAKNLEVKNRETLQIPEGMYVQISIRDSGMGVPKEHLNKIFDPYFTTKHKGSGLGLAVSYSIVKNHGGQITVDSELGKGAVFHIWLPSSTEQVLPESTEDEMPVTGKGRILVMDDEEIVRSALGDMLDDLGYSVEFAEDGSVAVDMYKKAKDSGKPFDAVIMDLTVPGGMGGKDAIREILSFDPSARAIVSSGYFNDPVMANYRDYGFSGVITKPYKIRQLSEELHRVIHL